VGRQGNELWAVTWQSGQRVGGWRGDSSIIIDAVTDKLEDFVEDLVAANPEQAKMPAHDTALLAAAERGDVTEVARLLESGADPNAIEGYASGHFDDTSPLYLAAQGGHLEVVRRLLARGADANQAVSSWLGQTALMVAAERGHADTLRALLEAGADVNAVDEIGRTSLHLVASRGHRLAAEILLKHGAEVNASDRNGQTALAVAVKEGHEELAAMLREHGGKE
jgi:ankyrin repeat protein